VTFIKLQTQEPKKGSYLNRTVKVTIFRNDLSRIYKTRCRSLENSRWTTLRITGLDCRTFKKLVSKDRFPKLKDFTRKMHTLEAHTCARVYFLP